VNEREAVTHRQLNNERQQDKKIIEAVQKIFLRLAGIYLENYIRSDSKPV
jgi:hypothetical protein